LNPRSICPVRQRQRVHFAAGWFFFFKKGNILDHRRNATFLKYTCRPKIVPMQTSITEYSGMNISTPSTFPTMRFAGGLSFVACGRSNLKTRLTRGLTKNIHPEPVIPNTVNTTAISHHHPMLHLCGHSFSAVHLRQKAAKLRSEEL